MFVYSKVPRPGPPIYYKLCPTILPILGEFINRYRDNNLHPLLTTCHLQLSKYTFYVFDDFFIRLFYSNLFLTPGKGSNFRLPYLYPYEASSLWGSSNICSIQPFSQNKKKTLTEFKLKVSEAISLIFN